MLAAREHWDRLVAANRDSECVLIHVLQHRNEA